MIKFNIIEEVKMNFKKKKHKLIFDKSPKEQQIEKDFYQIVQYSDLIEQMMLSYQEDVLVKKHGNYFPSVNNKDISYSMNVFFNDSSSSYYELENTNVAFSISNSERLQVIEYFSPLFDFPVNPYVNVKGVKNIGFSLNPFYKHKNHCIFANKNFGNIFFEISMEKYIIYALRFLINIPEKEFLQFEINFNSDDKKRKVEIKVSYKSDVFFTHKINRLKSKEDCLKLLFDLKAKAERTFIHHESSLFSSVFFNDMTPKTKAILLSMYEPKF